MVEPIEESAIEGEAYLRRMYTAAGRESDGLRDRALFWGTSAFVAANAAGFIWSLSNPERLENASLVEASFAVTIVLCFAAAISFGIAEHEMAVSYDDVRKQLDIPIKKRKPDIYARTMRKAHGAEKALNLPILIGLLAFVVSLTSFTFAARGLKMPSIANERRCLAIQVDMLSAAPRRKDGPELFQALGCRPKGEGSVYAPSPKRRDEPQQQLDTGGS